MYDSINANPRHDGTSSFRSLGHSNTVSCLRTSMTTSTVRSTKKRSPNKVIRSVEDLFRLMRQHDASHYIYRGEDDIAYKLRPKFGRYQASVHPDSEEIESALLREFCRRSAPHIVHHPGNDLEWLALAQHHGLATRLLDWTENLFVATYFAVKDLKPTDRTIYAFRMNGTSFIEPDASPFKIDSVHLFEPKHISPRISSQTGVFTVHPHPTTPFKHRDLERWVIKNTAVIDIAITLDRMGFNASTMFPGLDGIAFHVNDWYLRGALDD